MARPMGKMHTLVKQCRKWTLNNRLLSVDYATGNTNVNRPKEYEIEVLDIRTFDPQVCDANPLI